MDSDLAFIADWKELRRNWHYLAIWWNAADFVLSLACLLSDGAAMLDCRQIMLRLAELRLDEVTASRIQSFESFEETCVNMARQMPAAGIPEPVARFGYVGSLFCKAASSCARVTLSRATEKRQQRRLESIAELQKDFPRLVGLFE